MTILPDDKVLVNAAGIHSLYFSLLIRTGNDCRDIPVVASQDPTQVAESFYCPKPPQTGHMYLMVNKSAFAPLL
jgi:hypothetical protein